MNRPARRLDLTGFQTKRPRSRNRRRFVCVCRRSTSTTGTGVDARTPATDLVSWFFDEFDREFPTVDTQDIDRFRGTAIWSCTSFAVPVVAARLAVDLALGAADLADAVDPVIDAPYQTRIPCLGTIVTL